MGWRHMRPDFETRVAAAKRSIRASSTEGVSRRTFATTLEYREMASGSRRVSGTAIVYNSLSEDLGGFREKIAPGAASRVLQSADVRVLINHDPSLILARTSSGTARLNDSSFGLTYEADLPQTSYARDLWESLVRGDITQSSFAFRVAAGGDEWDEDPATGILVRTVNNFAGLYDVSPVTYPAYPASTSAPNGERTLGIPALDQDVMGLGADGRNGSTPYRNALERSLGRFERILG